MALAGNGVRSFAVDGEIVVSPQYLWVLRRGSKKNRRARRAERVVSSVGNDTAQWTASLWRKFHGGMDRVVKRDDDSFDQPIGFKNDDHYHLHFRRFQGRSRRA